MPFTSVQVSLVKHLSKQLTAPWVTGWRVTWENWGVAGVGLGWRTDWLALVVSPLGRFTVHLPSRVPGGLGDEPG